MPRIHFDDGVRETTDHRGIQVRGMKETREDGLACGRGIDRQSRELANAMTRHTQRVDLAMVEVIGGQSARRIETHADRSNDLALIVGKKCEQGRVTLSRRCLITTSGVAPFDQHARLAGCAGQFRKPNFECAFDPRRVFEQL